DIPFHEKKLGQLFCDGSAQAIVDLLKSECDQAGVVIELECSVKSISRLEGGPARFQLETSRGVYTCESLVVATGGLSIPKIGARGYGNESARQFGLALVETAPALDGFTFADAEMQSLRDLSGVSVDCVMTAGGLFFRENLLFTHSGLSGPAAL